MTHPQNFRAWLAFCHDLAATALAWAAMYLVRFNLDIREPYLADMAWTLAWILPLQGTIFVAFGLYRGLWRFASVLDLQRIVLAAGLGALLIPLVLVMLQLQAVVPRSVLIFYPIVLIFLMAGDRFAYRIWKEHRLYSPLAALGEPVLVVGAGEAGARLTRELARSRQWRVVGLIDDDPAKQGRLLNNVSVLGPISSLPAWAKKYGVRQVIVALPSAAHGVRRRVAEICADAGIEVLTVPSYEDLISGRSALTTIRTIELDDLLGRDPVVLDSAGLAEWLGNRVVMVTGAGGSIGAELCRHIARFRPAKIVLFDLSEAAVYEIQTALVDAFPQLPLATIVGDVKHASLVEEVLARERPSVIFHAGAYKHVPLMEETNAWQAVRNNAYGTWVLGKAAVAAKVEKFVLVSSDKAVNPTNVMGATKRLAEIVCQKPAGAGHAVRARALRQRLRQRGQRHPPLPRADRARRAGDRHAPRHHPLFHVAVRGDAAAAPGRAAGQGRRDPRARHGRARAHRRPRARHDPALRRRPGPHRDRVHRAAPRREALRGAADGRGGDAADAAPEAAHRAGARQRTSTRSARWSRGASAIAPADDAEVRARLKAWIPEYMPTAGAPVQPIPSEPAVAAAAPLPLRAPRRR